MISTSELLGETSLAVARCSAQACVLIALLPAATTACRRTL